MRVADAGFWGIVGAKGVVYPERGQHPELVKIPTYDGGPRITVMPTTIEATYCVNGGRLRIPTSVTVTGRPVTVTGGLRVGRDGQVAQVSYTWDDPELALANLPPWVRGWIERHQAAGR